MDLSRTRRQYTESVPKVEVHLLAFGPGAWGCVQAQAHAEKPEGVLHESFLHESLKSSLASRKPAVAAASCRPARADGPKVGLDARWPCKPQRRATASSVASALGRLRSATSAPA